MERKEIVSCFFLNKKVKMRIYMRINMHIYMQIHITQHVHILSIPHTYTHIYHRMISKEFPCPNNAIEPITNPYASTAPPNSTPTTDYATPAPWAGKYSMPPAKPSDPASPPMKSTEWYTTPASSEIATPHR